MSEYPVKMLFMTGLSRHGTPIIVDVLGENVRIPGGLYIRYPAGGTDTTVKDFLFDLPDEMVALQSERDELRARVAEYEAMTDDLEKLTRHYYVGGSTVVEQFKRLSQKADETEQEDSGDE